MSIPQNEMETWNAELILVDSNSTDNTQEVMNIYRQEANFPVKVVYLDQSGLGRARNAGIVNATGDIIAFTDDDCLLTPGYIRIASQVFDEKTFRYCGGKIIHNWNDPTTIIKSCQEMLKIIPAYSVIIPGITIEGASMVIHKTIFDAIGGFNPFLGAGTDFRCEDVEFIARASMHGFIGAYVPELIICHDHRRNAKAIEKLGKENSIARGAFYILSIMRGYRGYLAHWVKSSSPSRFSYIHHSYLQILAYELYGAILFLWMHRDQVHKNIIRLM
jgi:glycosyltransferase involved in cell wall biosynthesis